MLPFDNNLVGRRSYGKGVLPSVVLDTSSVDFKVLLEAKIMAHSDKPRNNHPLLICLPLKGVLIKNLDTLLGFTSVTESPAPGRLVASRTACAASSLLSCRSAGCGRGRRDHVSPI